MTIDKLMRTKPVTTVSTATLVDAAKAMVERSVGLLPVVDGGRLVGLITDRDIVVRSTARGVAPASSTVGVIMTREVVTISRGTDADEALRIMRLHRFRRLPVVDGARLVGVITLSDLADGSTDPREYQEAVAEVCWPEGEA